MTTALSIKGLSTGYNGVPVVRKHGDSHAGGDVELVFVYGKRGFKRVSYALDDRVNVFPGRDICNDENEFIAADTGETDRVGVTDARQFIGATETARDALRSDLENAVADGSTEGFVDAREVIDVDAEYCNADLAKLRVCQKTLEIVCQFGKNPLDGPNMRRAV